LTATQTGTVSIPDLFRLRRSGERAWPNAIHSQAERICTLEFICSALRKIALSMLSTSAALISGRVKTEVQRREQMIARCHIAVRDHTADLTRAIERTTAANSIKPATRLILPTTSPISEPNCKVRFSLPPSWILRFPSSEHAQNWTGASRLLRLQRIDSRPEEFCGDQEFPKNRVVIFTTFAKKAF